MFVGVVVENFHKCKEALEKEMLEKEAKKKLEKKLRKQMSKAQLLEKSELLAVNARGLRMSAKLGAEARELPYWYHYGPNRMYLHTIIMSKYFDLAIAAVIGVNVLTMAMEFYAMPRELDYALEVFNFFFTAVFTLEAIMKIVAMGFKPYFSDRYAQSFRNAPSHVHPFSWNQLDVGIVFLSIGGIVMEKMHTGAIPINPTIIRVMRVLRIARGAIGLLFYIVSLLMTRSLSSETAENGQGNPVSAGYGGTGAAAGRQSGALVFPPILHIRCIGSGTVWADR